jgi:hypothetical protein
VPRAVLSSHVPSPARREHPRSGLVLPTRHESISSVRDEVRPTFPKIVSPSSALMSISDLLAPSIQSSHSHRRSLASTIALDLVYDDPHAVQAHHTVLLLPENRNGVFRAGDATRFMRIPHRSSNRVHANVARSSRRSATHPQVLVHIATHFKQPLVFKQLFTMNCDALPPSYQDRLC